MTRITKKFLAAAFGLAVIYGNVVDAQACGGGGGGGGFRGGGGYRGGFGGGYGGYNSAPAYRPAYRPQPSYPPVYSQPPAFAMRPQPQVRPQSLPVSQFPDNGAQNEFADPSQSTAGLQQQPQGQFQQNGQPQMQQQAGQGQFQQTAGQGQLQQTGGQGQFQQTGGQGQPRQQVAQRPVSQSRQMSSNPGQTARMQQNPTVQQNAPSAPQTAAPQNPAELSALQALAGWDGEEAQPEAPAQAVRQMSADHVGIWTAQLGNQATVQLSLDAGGTFRWIATKDGKPNEFSGTYSLEGGSLTLTRASDSQQLAGSFTPNGTTAFNFKLNGAQDAGLNFTRT